MSISNKNKLYIKTGFCIYAAITVLVVVYVSAVFHWKGIDGLKIILVEGPNSKIRLTMFSVGMSWLLLGSILILLSQRIVNKSNFVAFVAFYLYSFIYLNFLRERTQYGDVGDYINAAFNLYRGEPFHYRYLYPPFWATLLQPLVPFGRYAVFIFCYIGNYFSILLFFALIYQVLKRYGFPKNFAALATFCILCVNVPILRNMCYIQVNIHVTNLIILSLLFYRKNIMLSALALSLAVHMKVSPIILILPFVFNRDWKFLIYFCAISVGIIVFTSLMNGFEYYPNFLSNVSDIYRANGINFRDNSIDSFIRSAFLFLNIDLNKAKYLILFFKATLLFVSLVILFQSVKKKIYYDGETKEGVIYNSYIVLLFPMVMLSPVVWVHHFVFIIYPFLIILKKISTVESLILYLLAYILIFLIPTFDFYPFSYNRLFGFILCYALLFSALRSTVNNFLWFKKINKKFEIVFERS